MSAVTDWKPGDRAHLRDGSNDLGWGPLVEWGGKFCEFRVVDVDAEADEATVRGAVGNALWHQTVSIGRLEPVNQ